jgi:uncharacterized protein (DUF433 family)
LSGRIILERRLRVMPIELSPNDLQTLREVASRKQIPTRRQRAQALLLLGQGKPPKQVAQVVGIKKADVEALADDFKARGIAVLKGGKVSLRSRTRIDTGIEKTRGVCGGAARIAGKRIPVWQLVEARALGASEAQILEDFPTLSAEDLVNAWRYEKSHRDEIRAEIHENEFA